MDDNKDHIDFADMSVTSHPDDAVAAARQDVEQTRANVGDTLEAIREKLDVQSMMTQAKSAISDVTSDVKDTVHTIVSDVSSHAKETAKDAATGAISGAVGEVKEAVGTAVDSVVDTTKKAGSSIMNTVKSNPLPSVLLLGAGWYLLSRRKPAHVGTNMYVGANSNGSSSGGVNSILDAAMQNPIPAAIVLGTAMHLYHNYNTTGASINGASMSGPNTNELAHKASDLVADAKGTITQTVDSVKGTLESAVDTVKETAGKATDAAGSLVGSVGDGVKQAGGSLKEWMHSDPLTVGLYALGIGATIAMLLPDTEPENHLMGSTRDSLVTAAHQTAGTLLDKVHTASSDAIESIPALAEPKEDSAKPKEDSLVAYGTNL